MLKARRKISANYLSRPPIPRLVKLNSCLNSYFFSSTESVILIFYLDLSATVHLKMVSGVI